MVFLDRKEAGKKLAKKLENFRGKNAVVFALPRGGVVTGYEIAKALHLPLSLVIVRKIGHPDNPEYAIAAVSSSGYITKNGETALVDSAWFLKEAKTQQKEAKRRKSVYLDNKKSLSAKGKIAIIVDDGIATGLTMRSSISELRAQNPREIVVAVPVIPKDTFRVLSQEVDKVIALDVPAHFRGAVGAYYSSFPQIHDEEVVAILRKKQ